MNKLLNGAVVLAAAFCCSIPGVVHAGLVGSLHDLSTTQTPQPCAFCHTPHNANTAQNGPAPLWNRKIDDMTKFVPYTSPTMNAICANTPNPISLACLSCHDGVSAQGMASAVTTSTHSLINYPTTAGGPSNYMPKCLGCHDQTRNEGNIYPRRAWQIGPDLSNDHPISVTYPNPGMPGFKAAPDQKNGWPDLKLYNSRVECSTCHDPHSTTFPTFLRKTNVGSALCFACHDK